MRPVALTIAGSDSGGGAGIQADLKTFAALGVYGTSAITAITAQNTRGVDAIEPVSPGLIYAQVKSVATDFAITAFKTGMLGGQEAVAITAEAVRDFNLQRLVVDPVMVSKSGHRLLAIDAENAMKALMIPLAYIVTPNLPEAEVLLGRAVPDVVAMRAAASALHELGAQHVLVKGGHLEGNAATDVFFDGKDFTLLESERIETKSTHGTGCTLSAAITAHLALGYSALESCQRAKGYLTQALKHAKPIGLGHGPVEHFWAVNSEFENRR